MVRSSKSLTVRVGVKGVRAMLLRPMKNPPHVGRFLRAEVIDELGLTVTAAAEVLGVTR